jgi:Leucine-rich repeat (LRR) protein
MAATTIIDFCLDDIYRMDWLVNFPNLKELNIVNQNVLEIEGIDKCRFLEKLWLNYNEIETIR